MHINNVMSDRRWDADAVHDRAFKFVYSSCFLASFFFHRPMMQQMNEWTHIHKLMVIVSQQRQSLIASKMAASLTKLAITGHFCMQTHTNTHTVTSSLTMVAIYPIIIIVLLHWSVSWWFCVSKSADGVAIAPWVTLCLLQRGADAINRQSVAYWCPLLIAITLFCIAIYIMHNLQLTIQSDSMLFSLPTKANQLIDLTTKLGDLYHGQWVLRNMCRANINYRVRLL